MKFLTQLSPFINSSSNNQIDLNMQSSNISKLTIVGGSLLAAAYLAFSYFQSQKKIEQKQQIKIQLSLETTRKIVQEIKYQMLIVCLSFTQKFKQFLQINLSQKQLEILYDRLRQNITTFYQQKQTIITEKYNIPKDIFVQALEKYSQDLFIIKSRLEIQDMMQRAIKGKLPDFKVPQPALDLLSLDQITSIYKELSFNVAILVLNKITQCIREDPNFNSKNDEDFKRAIRQISIYDYKQAYLTDKGFEKEWGCPNQTFFKIIEINKIKDPQFKRKMVKIEKSYEMLIDVVSHDPQQISQQGLKIMFEAKINDESNQLIQDIKFSNQKNKTKPPVKPHKIQKQLRDKVNLYTRKQQSTINQQISESIAQNSNPVVQL